MNLLKACTFSALAIAGLSLGTTSHAAGLKAVKPLNGYRCMVIDAPDEVMMDFQHPIEMHEAPGEQSPTVSGISTVFAVAEPPETSGGFIKTMNFAFKPGWVSTKWVKPYEAVHPGVKCVPSVMSDGKLGFDFPRK
ncbi:hypothetical protein [Acetobacter sp. UBA5411]|uniref:hypothetical protein n=1 Tax=Acetobacter sp. UBA5411 TaxID=1945905 RepID=UPI0025C0C6A2|nr:hypothetical protein [Acetobacter sp. UBA5411]